MKVLNFLFAFALIAQETTAFWLNGHQIVAAVAQERLSKKTYFKALSLIKELSKWYPDSSSFIGAAHWLDDINKETNDFFTWHFENTPIFGDDTKCTIKKKGLSLLEALPREVTYLQGLTGVVFDNQNTSKNVFRETVFDRYNYQFFEMDEHVDLRSASMHSAFAIRSVLHLLGDIHQPLHVSTFCSKQFKHGDVGGNSYKILFNHTSMSLHKFWDAMGFQYADDDIHSKSHFSFEEYQLKEKHSLIYARKQMSLYPPSFFEQYNADKYMAFHTWASESYALAQKYAYLVKPHQELPQEYIDLVQVILNQQVVLGGYRLANLLEKILN